MNNTSEIIGYKGLYEIDTLGNVMSIRRKKLLSLVDNHYGYLRVNLYKYGKIKSFFVHRLVAQAFIPNPKNYPHINHKDGNKKNNYYSNLEWIDRQGNMRHASKMGLLRIIKGEKHANAKLTDTQVVEIKQKYMKNNTTQRKLAKEYNISQPRICVLLKTILSTK